MTIEDPNPYASPSVASFAPSSTPTFTGQSLASRGDRFLGSLIDGLVLLPLSFGAGIAMGIVLVVAGLDPEGVPFQAAAAVFGGLIGASIFLVLNGYLLADRGQTIGKVVMKTRIVANDGTLVPIVPLILKRYVPLWIASSIPNFGPFLAIGNALAIFRENHKCIHDEIAGTKVIKIAG